MQRRARSTVAQQAAETDASQATPGQDAPQRARPNQVLSRPLLNLVRTLTRFSPDPN